ncbi:MAG: hypothetical protein LJD31_03055 [Wolbachia endosymbiont of Menacanthus eurysternus]|nr:hypothetical protein [Wolbachia endosymbiont of Menacanthus eurysternus]
MSSTGMTRGVAGKGSAGMTPITLSFQRVTLGSRNFIRLVSINVMLKYTILWKLDPSVGALG